MKKVLAELTIRRNGECILPKKVRQYLDLNPGDKLDIILENNQVVLKRVKTDYNDFNLKREDKEKTE